MREQLLEAFIAHAQGHIEKHRMNIEVYLTNAVGVGEHPDIIDAIETEMKEIAHYDDMIEMARKYFDQA